mmetsp:Transcript_80441/g.173904  ORF Transcript_80441/g.173904 Transcript_80441/m.173904 type:complete len:209 (-) Transcript_80441:282-908(-)
MEHLFNDLSEGGFLFDPVPHETGYSVVCPAVPDPVAGDDHEFTVLVDFVLLEVGVRQDLLLATRERAVGLVLEVADAATQIQVAVHPIVRHLAVGVFNAFLLLFVVGLVVHRREHHVHAALVAFDHYRPAVPTVRDLHVVLHHQCRHRGGSAHVHQVYLTSLFVGAVHVEFHVLLCSLLHAFTFLAFGGSVSHFGDDVPALRRHDAVL